MRNWFFSLQFRLILAFSLVLALTLSGISLYVGFAAQREAQKFQHMLDEARDSRVERIVRDRYSQPRGWIEVQPALEQAAILYGKRIQLRDPQGRLIADSHEFQIRTGISIRQFQPAEVRIIPVMVSDGQIGSLALISSEQAQQFEEEVPPEPPYSRLASEINRLLLLGGTAAGLAGILIVSLVSQRVLEPARTLTSAARKLGQGDLSQRVPTEGPSEIGELAYTFNVMAENLQKAEQQRRALVADVAHELRTPLSNIQGYLEAIKDGLLEPKAANIDIIYQQVVHLTHLVEDLRVLALAEAGNLRLNMEPGSIEDLLRRTVEAVRPRAEAKELDLSLTTASEIPLIRMDRTRIAQVVSNLVENAIFHTPSGGSVKVSAEVVDSRARVTVADTGEGIPREKLDIVFERFYRVDPSRTRATGGTGLGLTIAKQLVQAHGGTIWAERGFERGVRFIFELPVG